MKLCKRCNQQQPKENFCVNKAKPDGRHIYCKECKLKESKEYYEKTKHDRADYYKQHRLEHKSYFNAYCHNHYHTNKELYREWERDRYANDVSYRIKKTVSSRIHSALKTYQLLKKDRTLEYLGCSIGEYCVYLESKFDNKMDWDNQGTYWQIDHIKPIASFDLSNEEELYKVFHYTNTQPLEATENRLKSDNLLYL